MSKENLSKIKADLKEYSKYGTYTYILDTVTVYISLKELSEVIELIKDLPVI